jgi:hypothetical protein
VAINPGYAGRTFQPSGPYEVSRVKIAEFADAIGETSPLCRDLSMAAVADLAHEPDLGLNYAMVVHGLQSFTHARPLHAGDVVVSQSTIESVKPLGRMTTMTTVTEIRTVAGEQVCTARSALVERGPVEPGPVEPGTVEPGA